MSYVKGKNKNQILEELKDTPEVGSLVHEQQKAALIVRCTEDIEASLNALKNQLKENAESSDRLGVKVFWLNIVLALATLVGAIATVVIAIKTT
jgi:hypothetical protein